MTLYNGTLLNIEEVILKPVGVWESGTDGTISDVHAISIVSLLMIGDFQSRGNFPSVTRHPSPGTNFVQQHNRLS